MAARDAVDFTFQQDVTSSEMDSLPKGQIAYLRYTTSDASAAITTETLLSGFQESISTAGNNRFLKFHAQANVYTTAGAGADNNWIHAELRVREDSASTGTVVAYGTGIIGGDSTTEMVTLYATGLAINVSGDHTYYVTLTLSDGTATLAYGHSSTKPGFLIIEDLGATS